MRKRTPSVNGMQGVITFIGTTPNIGTTLCAIASAYRLATMTGKQVGYLCLNFKSSKLHRFLGIDAPLASIDDLLPQIRSNSLSLSILDSAMHSAPNQANLKILFGNRYREMAEYFTAEDVMRLISLAKQRFDYLILDCNAYWDNAGTICSLQQANYIVAVTTDALSHFQEDGRAWFSRMASFIELERSHFYSIVVRQQRSVKNYRTQEIMDELKMTQLGEVELPPTLLHSLDEGELAEWLMQSSEGKQWMHLTWLQLLKKKDRVLVQQPRRNAWKRMQQLWQGKIGESL